MEKSQNQLFEHQLNFLDPNWLPYFSLNMVMALYNLLKNQCGNTMSNTLLY